MMLWFYVAIVAYALNAIAFVIDKYLLVTAIPRPFAYAFWVAILSTVAVVLIPFGVHMPDSFLFIVSFISGMAFFFALIFLYRVIRKTDASIASTEVNVISVVAVYFLAIFILGDHFDQLDIIYLGLLIAGIFLLGKISHRVWREAFVSGILFGISVVTLKLSFDLSDLVNGAFWTRVGFVGTALMMLIIPAARREILHSFRTSHVNSKLLFVLSKFIAGTGFILLDIALRLGHVSSVNALLGAQFVFIFIISLILGSRFPEVAETSNPGILVRKLSGMALVVFGLILLFK